MTFFAFMLLFALYSFIGWVMETIYCSIPAKKFVYRGFLMGPVCPIYGFGALAVVLILSPISGHPELIFCCGLILTSLLEYGVSFLLEKLFKKSWWDYSNKKFNINGRICLQNSILFGALSLLLIYVLNPAFGKFLTVLPTPLQQFLAASLILVFGVDLFFSVRNTLDFNREMIRISELTEKIEHKRDELKSYVDAFRDEKRDRIEFELAALQSAQEESLSLFFKRMRRILNAFPHMRLQRKDSLSLHEHLLSYRWKK